MASLGWHDPIWADIYKPIPTAPMAAPTPQGEPLLHYLDQMQQAAAAGQQFNLSDLPGYQTNLQTPALRARPAQGSDA